MKARLALKTDREVCLALSKAAAEERDPELGWSRDAAEETFDLAMGGSPTLFVVERRGEVVGLSLASIEGFAFSSGVFVCVQVVYVRPDIRGTRAAVVLLQAVVNWSLRLNARRTAFSTLGHDALDQRTARFLVRCLSGLGTSKVGYCVEVDHGR